MSSGIVPTQTVRSGYHERRRRGYTYTAGLPLSGEQLQLLVVAELHHDVDGPLLVVLVLAYPDLARTANAVERGGELLANAANQLLQLRLPVVLVPKLSATCTLGTSEIECSP